MNPILLLVTAFLLLSSCQREAVTNIYQTSPTENEPQNKASNGATEGTINGGGGKGILCRGPEGPKLELLDLYEARTLFGLDIRHAVQNETEMFDLLAELFAKHMWNPSTIERDQHRRLVRTFIVQFWNTNKRFIPAGRKLKPTNDAFEPVLDPNCEIVQIAHMYDENIILVDPRLWDQLNWTDRAALIAHEFFYAFDRTSGGTNSMATRRLIGQMFSTQGAQSRADGVPIDRSKYGTCHLNQGEQSIAYFYVYESVKKESLTGTEARGVELVFNYFHGSQHSKLFRLSAFVEGLDLEQFFSATGRTLYLTLTSDARILHDESLNIRFEQDGHGRATFINGKTGQVRDGLTVNCSRPYTGP